MKKSKLTLILQILLIISILALVGVVAYDYYEGNQTEKNVDDILKQTVHMDIVVEEEPEDE